MRVLEDTCEGNVVHCSEVFLYSGKALMCCQTFLCNSGGPLGLCQFFSVAVYVVCVDGKHGSYGSALQDPCVYNNITEPLTYSVGSF